MKTGQIPRSLRTTLIYILFGCLWILLSDSVLEFFIPHTSPAFPFAQTLKGWFFILFSASMLYVILRRDEKTLTGHIMAERKSQRLYRDLFDSNPHPMWVYDLETLRFLMVNDAAVSHYGYSREEFLKMTLKDIRPAEQIPALLANLANPPQVLERSSGWQHIRKDGTLIDVEISSHSLNFEDRSARMVLAKDITEEKKTEEALRTSEAKFRNLVEYLPAATYIASLDDLSTTLYISPQIEQILGFTPDEFLNPPDTWMKQVHPEDRERVLEELRTSRKNETPFNSEYRMIKKNGEIVWINDAANLVRDSAGKPLLNQGFMIDISERVRSEIALKVSEENYRNLAETSDSAIAVLDRQGKLLYANPTSLLVWEDPHLVGKTVQDLFPKKIADGYLSVMRHVIDERIVDVNEITTRVKGREMWFQVSMMPIKNSDGSVNTLLLNAWNLTERKRAEEAQRQSEIMFFKIFRSSPIGIHIFRLSDGRSFNVNDAFLEMAGYSREEIIKQTAKELDLFVDEEARDVWMNSLKEGRRVLNQDAMIRRKSGEIRNCLASLDIIEINGESMVMIIMTDITERKQAEDLLKQSEERFRNTLDTMLEGCQMIDFDWRYIYVNESVARQGRNIPEQLLGKTMMEVYPGIEYTELFSKLRECMNDRKSSRFENEFFFPDGASGWFELSIHPVPEGIFILSIDITESKLAEEQLRNSEERFRLMAENIEEGFWITDPETHGEVYLSPANERIFGRSVEELMQTQNAFLENIVPEDRSHVLATMERQKLGEPTSMEYRIQRADGKLRWIWDRAFPILKEDGTVKYVTGLVSDITERKETEARIQTQLRRLSALNAIDRAISVNTDLTLTMNLFIMEAILQLQVDAADVLLMNPHMQTLHPISQRGFETATWGNGDLKLGKGLAGRAALEQNKVIVDDLSSIEDPFVRIPLHEEEGFISYFGIPLVAKGQVKGVLEVFHRSRLNPDPEWLYYLETLAGQAAIAIENAQLFDGLQRSNQELMLAYDATIAGWSHAMDLRDKETEGHTQRVTELTLKLAERMGVGEQEQVQIRRGALLHDIGKLGIPDDILHKPGKLSKEEWVIMRKHPIYARDMLNPVAYLRPALDIPYCHHEKWDGSGYPRGLKGEEIPLSARIFAVVDVWDALRSDRPYRDSWSAQKTRDYILAESGKHFDPNVVQAFMQLLEENPDMLL